MSKPTVRHAYEPTEAEKETIGNLGLKAAMTELKVFEDIETMETQEGLVACLKAFKAAKSAMKQAKNKLLETKGYSDQKYVSFFPETSHIVCSAMYAISTDLQAEECSYISICGRYFSILCKAAIVLESLANVYSAFENDDEFFGTYMDEEALALAEASKKQN